MDVERLPGWFKALAASLWVMFVLAPLFVWLAHRFGSIALLTALPSLAVTFLVFRASASEEDTPDAEYYRRKARARAANE